MWWLKDSTQSVSLYHTEIVFTLTLLCALNVQIVTCPGTFSVQSCLIEERCRFIGISPQLDNYVAALDSNSTVEFNCTATNLVNALQWRVKDTDSTFVNIINSGVHEYHTKNTTNWWNFYWCINFVHLNKSREHQYEHNMFVLLFSACSCCRTTDESNPPIVTIVESQLLLNYLKIARTQVT
jgi:hypothetical protein